MTRYQQYTQQLDDLYTQSQRNLNERYQAEYEYHGAVDINDDPADYYVPLKGVAIA